MRQGHNGEGIIFNTGASWQEQRKFLANTLRDLSKGDSRMEDLINKEVSQFCENAGDTLAAQINTEGVRYIPVGAQTPQAPRSLEIGLFILDYNQRASIFTVRR